MTVRRVRWQLRQGDSGEVLRSFRPASFDALVTDPPAGVGFMEKEWDQFKDRASFVAFLQPIFVECLRVMKPGAFGLVWALPRTSHWTMVALEDAGFEVRDRLTHLFGTGFPKGTDKAKIPAEWQGFNTALKPGGEDWVLVRRKPSGTIAENLLEHGTGALNIDACRLAVEGPDNYARNHSGQRGHAERAPGAGATDVSAGGGTASELGRWPSNVVLDESAAAELDQQAGRTGANSPTTGLEPSAARTGQVTNLRKRVASGPVRDDRGGASRFFFTAKPSRSERDAGCEHLEPKAGGEATGRKEGSAGTKNPRAGAGRGGGARNHHPTVKAQSLMRWLVRLVTPPGGLVLDPFTGSGSTGCAVLAEGARFVGIEREAEYSEIARARLHHAAMELTE